MADLKENKSYYASDEQRKILIELITNSQIRDNFFLTGGTALSVFYLNHRISEDIDLFTRENIQLSDIDFWISRNWAGCVQKINETKYYLSYLINNVKVDIVIDELSNDSTREKYFFDNYNFIYIDNIKNIISNKLCVLVSRSEVKDYLDFYFLCKNFNDEQFSKVYGEAVLKDTIFKDPPTVGFQIEEGYKFVIRNHQIYPKLFKDLNDEDFEKFYIKCINHIYKLKNKF